MRRALATALMLLAAGMGTPAAVEGGLAQAEQQFEAGNYPAAMTTLRTALNADGHNAAGYYWMGRCYYELRDYDNAIGQLETAVKYDSQNSVYHQWLGRAYGSKADRDRSFFGARRARKEFETAVELNGGNLEARRDLMNFYAQAPWIVGGSKDSAKEQAEAIAKADPIAGYVAWADFFADQKRYDEADQQFQKLLSANPNRIEPYFEAADFYRKQGNPGKLAAVLESAGRLRSTDPRLNFYHGVLNVLRQQKLTEAEQLLKAYLAMAPERSDWPPHAAARVWLGRTYELEGKRAEAAEQYRAALQLDPNRADAKEGLKRLERSPS